ncbi:MAG: DUF1566 domain-containing protein [Bacteroidota bacterium]|nr:DUF1566 domain-containing protein [Bacteroidota bacterium]
MKKLFTILAAVLITATLWAQSPEKMSYQAVIRDASDNLITDTQVGMQLSILQGSAGGIEVYVETQTPTTNANGLVSIEIGAGTVESGDFTAIDWTAGSYFIKTETDPAGGTNYSITGTSQLLSVPYALHAKTATETDPVYSGSEAANIDATDITNLGNLSGVNNGDQDLSTLATKTALGDSTAQVRSEIPDVSGIATNTQAIQDTAAQIRSDISTVTTYSVGDYAFGGIVFWVDESGKHGLVCAIEDISDAMRWNAGTHGLTRATGSGIYAGLMNTQLIISGHVSIGDDGDPYAASLCNEYTFEEYGDWYLPSDQELLLMYNNKDVIDVTAANNGGSAFTTDIYWSSTEGVLTNARDCYFSNGNLVWEGKAFENRVRPIRKF